MVLMEEQELPPIQITDDDIREANQLSLHCPICAGPVEKFVNEADLRPVVCDKCGTLYHQACWQQNGGKCAILGCDSQSYQVFGQEAPPQLVINYQDVQKAASNGYSATQRRLKDEQRRQVEQLRRPSLLRRLFQWLLDQIKIG